MKKKEILNRIIGSGFIANNFNKHIELFEKLNICAYAAGVSNSLCKSQDLLEKDKKRLFDFKNQILKNATLMYFSTCSIEDPSRNQTPYVKNKLIIENYIKKNFAKYLIVRLPEVVGKSNNSNTLINFFFEKIKNKKTFEVWANASRNIIGIDDVIKILIDLLLNKNVQNSTINIANPKNSLAKNIVDVFEKILMTKAEYNLVNKGHLDWKIDVGPIHEAIKNCKIDFGENYLENILKKYFI